MLAIVNSANVACGGHAGDPDVMRRTLRLAREHGVSIGAHPSYPDLRNFGRRAMSLAPAELENQLAAQIGALMGIAAMEGVRVSHVKPHGALNNQACEDAALAGGAAACLAHVLKMLDAGALIATDGTRIPTPIGSICVHGDSPGAIEVARHLRRELAAIGYASVPLPALATGN